MLGPSGLVNICGVGGLGKTRLAIEVAQRLSGVEKPGMDVFWVPLIGVSAPAELATAIGQGLGMHGLSGDEPLGALVAALGDAPALLVIDNCEHIGAPCGKLVSGLLAGCPRLRVLATSRTPLEVDVEQVCALPPLGGQTHGELGQTDATDLLIDRAAVLAASYAFTPAGAEMINQICRQVAGLPLAIELVASWIRVLSPRDLLSRIEAAMDAPGASDGTGLADRHRSMRAILDGSWQWLSEEDRSVLAGLAVFVGGFTREAAEAVTRASMTSLATLVERSLIQRLPETLGALAIRSTSWCGLTPSSASGMPGRRLRPPRIMSKRSYDAAPTTVRRQGDVPMSTAAKYSNDLADHRSSTSSTHSQRASPRLSEA